MKRHSLALADVIERRLPFCTMRMPPAPLPTLARGGPLRIELSDFVAADLHRIAL
jgi:hypothetical protein